MFWHAYALNYEGIQNLDLYFGLDMVEAFS